MAGVMCGHAGADDQAGVFVARYFGILGDKLFKDLVAFCLPFGVGTLRFVGSNGCSGLVTPAPGRQKNYCWQ